MRLGRILGGVGAAAASMASKYIDEELAQQRAQAMADLQVKTASRIRDDQAAFDDMRAPTLRQRAVEDARAAATTEDEIELSRLTNNPLIAAKRKVATDDAMSAAAAQRQAVKDAGADADYLKANERIELADPKARAQINASRAAAASAFASAKAQGLANRAAERVQSLTDSMLAVLDDETLSPEQRGEKLAGLQSRLDLLVPKKDDGKNRPTQEIVEEYDGEGRPIGRTVTTKGPAGMGGGGQASAGTDTQALIDYAIKNGKVPQLVAKMEADGMSPGDIMRAVGEDQYAKAKGADKKAAAAQPKPEPKREQVPADSPSGIWQARQQVLRDQQAQQQAQKQKEAAAAFEAMGRDPFKAQELQRSPLFSHLSREQKAEVFRIVNAR